MMYSAQLPQEEQIATMAASVLYNLVFHAKAGTNRAPHNPLTTEQHEGIIGACQVISEEGANCPRLIEVCNSLSYIL